MKFAPVFKSTLAVAAVATVAGSAQASTITDAYLHINSAFDVSGGIVDVNGTISGMVSGDPSIERPYQLSANASLGTFFGAIPLFDATLSTDELTSLGLDTDGNGKFSMNQTYGLASSILDDYDLDDDLDDLFSGFQIGTEYSDSFDFSIDRGKAAFFLCGGGFGQSGTASIQTGGDGGDCLSNPFLQSGNLALNVDLTYEDDEPAPVPLPATLPLLAAGLGGVVALRRLRRPRI